MVKLSDWMGRLVSSSSFTSLSLPFFAPCPILVLLHLVPLVFSGLFPLDGVLSVSLSCIWLFGLLQFHSALPHESVGGVLDINT